VPVAEPVPAPADVSASASARACAVSERAGATSQADTSSTSPTLTPDARGSSDAARAAPASVGVADESPATDGRSVGSTGCRGSARSSTRRSPTSSVGSSSPAQLRASSSGCAGCLLIPSGYSRNLGPFAPCARLKHRCARTQADASVRNNYQLATSVQRCHRREGRSRRPPPPTQCRRDDYADVSVQRCHRCSRRQRSSTRRACAVRGRSARWGDLRPWHGVRGIRGLRHPGLR